MRNKKSPYVPPSLIPADIPAESLSIAREVDRLHENVKWSAQGQFEQLKLWRLMNYVLGVPAALLAAVAGGTSLANPQVSTRVGILALLAAGFSAVLTTLNPSRRVTQAQTAANALLELQTALRQFLTIDLTGMTGPDARAKLETLTARRDEINGAADPPGWYAAWRARRSVEGGRQDNAIDQGGRT